MGVLPVISQNIGNCYLQNIVDFFEKNPSLNVLQKVFEKEMQTITFSVKLRKQFQ